MRVSWKIGGKSNCIRERQLRFEDSMLRKLILENLNSHKTSGRNTVHKRSKTEKRLKIGNDSGAQSTVQKELEN